MIVWFLCGWILIVYTCLKSDGLFMWDVCSRCFPNVVWGCFFEGIRFEIIHDF